jgi:Amidase
MPNPATNLAAPWRLTAREASRAMAEGSLTCDALARSYLDRIAGREFELSAWAFVDPGHVVRQAWELDKLPRRSPLHGVPISIKDMIDTAEMPTGNNSNLFVGHRPSMDAAVVGLCAPPGSVCGAVGSEVQGPVAENCFLIAGNRDPQKAQILRYGPRQSPTTAAERTWMFISFDEERSWS